MLEQIGGRKLAISIVALLISVGAVIVKGDVPPGLSSMLQFLVGAFIAGNVITTHIAASAGTTTEVNEGGNDLLGEVNQLPPGSITPIPGGLSGPSNKELQDNLSLVFQTVMQRLDEIKAGQGITAEGVSGVQTAITQIVQAISKRP